MFSSVFIPFGSRHVMLRTMVGMLLVPAAVVHWVLGHSLAESRELDLLAGARRSIVSDDLRRHVELLADDTLEGRAAGSRGGYTAGNYAAQTFQRYLEPAAGPVGYFQTFGPRYRNLLGRLSGSDPRLSEEIVLIGAHYDHVGYGNRRNSNGPIGLIHNGADDNASGVAAVLELIQALGESELRPARSLLFALWDGEEQGLLGSQHWVDDPTVPLSQVKLAINLDMIGRLRHESLEVFGTRTMGGLRRLVSESNESEPLTLRFPWKIEENSDHYSFFRRRIPVLMYHTGLHDDYHRPSDDTELVNFAGLQSTTRLVFNMLMRLSEAETELRGFRVAARFEGETRQREYEQALPAPPPRLGLAWRPVPSSDPPGLTVQQVRPGSAADRAGIRPRDVLVSLNDQPLTSSELLQQSVVTAVQLRLGVWRAGRDSNEPIIVQLDGNPVRLGFSWRYSDAEPDSLAVVRVLRHSPAELGGLRVGDRIHELAGRKVDGSPEFQQLATQVELPALIRIERAGQIRELRLPAAVNPLQVTTTVVSE